LLAGVSSHYYARLEQGRDRNPSASVLDALATVLDLDEEGRRHLHQLAQPAAPRRRRVRRAERIRPGLAQLLDRWVEQPAVVVGRHRDVLAANALAIALHEGFTPGRNLLRDVFLDPIRETYLDWNEVAEGAVAGVRSAVGSDLDDPRLTELIGELSLKSREFRAMWARHDVRERTAGVKRYDNPLVGEIELDYQTFAVTGAVGQTLFLFTAEPGSKHADSLRLLASIVVNAPSQGVVAAIRPA
jgi:transcriptional regulator with XRE-family HTH domain